MFVTLSKVCIEDSSVFLSDHVMLTRKYNQMTTTNRNIRLET